MTCEFKCIFYFALAIPVNTEFLKCILREANVVLTDNGCIRRILQKNGGNFELVDSFPGEQTGNYHKSKRIKVDNDVAIWTFLVGKVVGQRKLMVRGDLKTEEPSFWLEYKLNHFCMRTTEVLAQSFIDLLAPRVHMLQFDLQTIVKLYFALDLPVHKEIIDRIKESGKTRFDKFQRIVDYNDGQIHLTCANNPIYDGDMDLFTEEEDTLMWQYVSHKLRDPETGSPRKIPEIRKHIKIWNDFPGYPRFPRRHSNKYYKRFSHILLPNLVTAKLDKMTKIGIYFGLDIPLDAEFLKLLRTTAIVELDGKGCILVYKEKKRRVNSEVGFDEKKDDVIDINSGEKEDVEKRIVAKNRGVKKIEAEMKEEPHEISKVEEIEDVIDPIITQLAEEI
uniref:SPK domain-containing protein n=1 Tax=Caenorhabditis japonica TaxID=281687 RepID=A0A8R1IXS0_CAEJA